MSDTLVLTEDEAVNIFVTEMKSVSSESEKGDMELKGETDSDASEEGKAYESDRTEGETGFVTETNYDSKVQPIPVQVNKVATCPMLFGTFQLIVFFYN